MPLYEYRCTSCGYSFEKIQSFSAEPEKVCPKCQGELIRPVTAPALRFEGAGWYVNDYAGKGGAKAGESSAKAGADGASSQAATKTDAAAPGSSGATETKAAPAPAAPTASSSTPPTSGS